MKHTPIDETIDHDICGIEIEYAFTDCSGTPIFEIENKPLIDALYSILDTKPSLKKHIEKLGGYKEEVFKHQIESRTHPHTQQYVEQYAKELHDILLHTMKEEFGLIASQQQPIPYPGGGVELLTPIGYYQESMQRVNTKGKILSYVSPKSYYINAIEQITDHAEDLSFARNASTTAIHLHRSRKTIEETMKTYYALAMKTSNDILYDPTHRYVSYGMGLKRYEARKRIVGIRKRLQEVLNGIDDVLIHTPSPRRKPFVINRYFDGIDPGFSHTSIPNEPKRDHRSRVLKKPSTITVEGRTADGPGESKEAISHALKIYQHKTQQAIYEYNTLCK